jgi:glycerol-3-phosphate O-acyltransferase
LEEQRSRSGKVQAPNEALFARIVKMYLNGNDADGNNKDILFVPVTINYDRIVEGDQFPLDLLGETPKKESFFKIVKVLLTSKKQLGKVIVRYGEPQSLQGFLNHYLSKNNELSLATIRQNPQKIEKFSKKFEEELSYSLVDNLVVMTTSLIATVVLMNRRGISLDLL